MREMLEPVFGEVGALVAQLVITVVVVLVLIAAVYWLVRRFSGLRLGGIGRGRVPRLAIVDAMAIDSRRRLVLIRRDNVEHLIMIGGPSDLVVEPSIMRLRPRAAQQPARTQQAPAATMPSSPPAPPAPPTNNREWPKASAPIPFPPQRAFQQRPPETVAEPSFYPLRRGATAASPPDSADQPPPDDDAVEPFLPEMVRPEADPAEAPMPRFPEPIAASDEPNDPGQRFLDLGDETPPAAVAYDGSADAPAPERDTTAKVSELEEEMARLLGEITANRSSS